MKQKQYKSWYKKLSQVNNDNINGTYEQGFKAYAQGNNSCPYKTGSIQEQTWLQGFYRAKFIKQDQKD